MKSQSHQQPIICIGAALVDDYYYCTGEPQNGTSNPASHFRSAGGVARNVAHHLAQLGNPVELVSVFGDDPDGKWLKDVCTSSGMGLQHSLIAANGTGHFTGIIAPSGELFTGASDTHLGELLSVSYLEQKRAFIETASLILCECNLPAACVDWLINTCRSAEIACVIEPVSVVKASMLKHLNLTEVLLISPNILELPAISEQHESQSYRSAAVHLLERGVRNVWIRKGEGGSEMFFAGGSYKIPAPKVRITDTTGAGDAALAGWIHARQMGKNAQECVLYGHAMAQIILQTRGAYVENLNSDLLERTVG